MSISIVFITILTLIVIVLSFSTWYFFKKFLYLSTICNNVITERNNLQNSIITINKERDNLFNKVSEETNQRISYQNRCLELEDAIKEGVGVSLRKEVTRVSCVFDQHEMHSLLEGSRYLIKEYWKETGAIKFYLKLIEKIEQNLGLMIKEKENENKLTE